MLLNWDMNSLSLANARINLGIVIIPPAADPISATKIPTLTILIPKFPSRFSETMDNGAFDKDNVLHGIMPKEMVVTKIPRTPTIIVPKIIAFGITFSGSRVSSERYVALSHPKKLSAMKKIVIKIDEAPKAKNGE